jgi:hypothetical protein
MMRLRFIVSLFCAGAIHAQTFTVTGKMGTPRSGHAATLLLDGKVLITGGYHSTPGNDPSAPLTSAELYDPATGTFTAASGMTAPRAFHTATLLADGTVLIAGGQGYAHNDVVSAELYDPVKRLFRPLADMAGAHTRATRLADGRVLMAGNFAARAEIHDPVTATFSIAGSYGGSQCESPDILLPDGTVLIGETQPPVLFDPTTTSFRATSPMMYCGHDGAALLINGKAVFAGGDADYGRSNRAELYDPGSGSFTATGNLIENIAWPSSTLLPDGTALFRGGELNACTPGFCQFDGSSATAEIYDANAGTFAAAGLMATRRELHTATVLNDGTVLIAGGVSYGGIGLYYGSQDSAEIYHPAIVVPLAALLSLSSDGKGQGAIQHAGTYQIVTADNPAVAGEIVIVYCTRLIDGGLIPPQVSVGGRMAEVLWFGGTPGYSGLKQINVRVPGGVAAGDTVPVRLNYLSRPSNEVTISVR